MVKNKLKLCKIRHFVQFSYKVTSILITIIEMAQEVDKDRMDQILKLDIPAVLKSIHELEVKLSNPSVNSSFLETISSSLSKLETRISSIEQKDEKVGELPKISEELSPEAAMNFEDKLMDRIRSEISELIVQNDSKINSLTMEVERLEKLLSIRPTTTELQQVVVLVHDTEKKTSDLIDSVHISLMTQVKNSIASEMGSIIVEMRNSRSLNEQSIGIISKRVESFYTELTDARQMIIKSLASLQPEMAELKERQKTCDESLSALESSLQNESQKLAQSVEELDVSLKEMINDEKTITLGREEKMIADRVREHEEVLKMVQAIEIRLSDTEMIIKRDRDDSETRDFEQQSKIGKLEAILKQTREIVDSEQQQRIANQRVVEEMYIYIYLFY